MKSGVKSEEEKRGGRGRNAPTKAASHTRRKTELQLQQHPNLREFHSPIAPYFSLTHQAAPPTRHSAALQPSSLTPSPSTKHLALYHSVLHPHICRHRPQQRTVSTPLIPALHPLPTTSDQTLSPRCSTFVEKPNLVESALLISVYFPLTSEDATEAKDLLEELKELGQHPRHRHRRGPGRPRQGGYPPPDRQRQGRRTHGPAPRSWAATASSSTTNSPRQQRLGRGVRPSSVIDRQGGHPRHLQPPRPHPGGPPPGRTRQHGVLHAPPHLHRPTLTASAVPVAPAAPAASARGEGELPQPEIDRRLANKRIDKLSGTHRRSANSATPSARNTARVPASRRHRGLHQRRQVLPTQQAHPK